MPTFWYFAYGTSAAQHELEQELHAAGVENAGAAVRSAQAAYIEGYRVAFSAVSCANARLGCLNLVPMLPPRSFTVDGGASPVQSAVLQAEKLEEKVREINPSGRVYGVLYELAAESRAALLEAVGREGSFNRVAELTCTIASADGTATATQSALVVAALNLDMISTRYEAPESFVAMWKPLPPLSSNAPDDAARVSDGSGASVYGTGRWPGTHACNWPTSERLAPSAAYLQALVSALGSSPLGPAVAAAAQTGEGEIGPMRLLTRYYGLGGGTADTTDTIETRNPATDASEARLWYLAYGSNLSWEQVCLRIGPAHARKLVRLDGYELVPNKTPYSSQYKSFGYFNVEPCAQRRTKEREGIAAPTTMPPYVCGAAYDISQAQLSMMDGYERGYHRELLPCASMHADPHSADGNTACWVYVADSTCEEVLPSKEYLSRVLEGADLLPKEYIDGIRRTPTNPLRSPRQDRRLRKEL